MPKARKRKPAAASTLTQEMKAALRDAFKAYVAYNGPEEGKKVLGCFGIDCASACTLEQAPRLLKALALAAPGLDFFLITAFETYRSLSGDPTGAKFLKHFKISALADLLALPPETRTAAFTWLEEETRKRLKEEKEDRQ